MTKVALRGIASRKLRAFTTWLAIFLGVALVGGTYILTDTINESFGEIFSESLKGTDVAITANTNISSDDTGPPPFDASLLPRVRDVEGVEAARLESPAGIAVTLFNWTKEPSQDVEVVVRNAGAVRSVGTAERGALPFQREGESIRVRVALRDVDVLLLRR